MNRRNFLRVAGVLAGGTGLSRITARAGTPVGPWRTFDLTTHVALPTTAEITHVWVPLPLVSNQPFQQSLDTTVRCEGGDWKKVARADEGLALVAATFGPRSTPVLSVTSRVKVRDWGVDLGTPGQAQPLSPREREMFLRPTRYVPTDGIVHAKAMEITAGVETDEDQARAIYEWIVTNAYRKASVRGCGTGDVRPLLQTGDLGGKCADLSALFVGLSRAAGAGARGIRPAGSPIPPGIQESRSRDSGGQPRAALPRRGLAPALWMGARRSSRCT